jgi:hypothetical protein
MEFRPVWHRGVVRPTFGRIPELSKLALLLVLVGCARLSQAPPRISQLPQALSYRPLRSTSRPSRLNRRSSCAAVAFNCPVSQGARQTHVLIQTSSTSASQPWALVSPQVATSSIARDCRCPSSRVGINRPDLQFDYNGRRYHVEYDSPTSGRGSNHQSRLTSNDPEAEIILLIVP